MRYSIVLSIFLCLLLGCCSEQPNERILFDFETDRELDRFHWKCHTLLALSDDHVTHGRKSLKLELFPSEYPGLAPMIKDTNWSKHETLRFDVYNPQSSVLPLTVRIDDRDESADFNERSNKTFSIKPGANTVSIPLKSLVTSGGGRPLNLKSIRRLVVFMGQPKETTVLYFDYFRLGKVMP